ncbi:Lrp/AsnC family transcriptional regulator [Sphingomonas sp. S1-29]|uniref:Lrp/AsnC family transcriptional regulator n=1 Tax=Sphingomonas sp. S1-29 TaxID=2991074 RepID=UPI00223E9C10|nr:Lrp/AsnC family transcriptional regulator [Sphingomonas sp. S1-29]UZK68803.1 Lrp/AsnC family transcriptional regulator [Sphingomonas sp. S1-29]
MLNTLDALDRRIVNQMRLNARITNSALAREVGLSESACLRRLKLLERSRVIRGYTAIISGGDPDEGTVAIVQVELERQSEEYLARFEAAMRKHSEIRAWYLLTGAGDYLLRLEVAGMEDYANFHRDVLSRLPGVTRITSSFAMRSHRKA